MATTDRQLQTGANEGAAGPSEGDEMRGQAKCSECAAIIGNALGQMNEMVSVIAGVAQLLATQHDKNETSRLRSTLARYRTVYDDLYAQLGEHSARRTPRPAQATAGCATTAPMSGQEEGRTS